MVDYETGNRGIQNTDRVVTQENLSNSTSFELLKLSFAGLVQIPGKAPVSSTKVVHRSDL